MLKNSFGRLAGIAAGSVASLALAAQALAQEAAPAAAAAPPPTLSAGDTAWMLISTALVLMMTLPGLALFYGGMVRKKNVLTILMQCFSVAALCSVLWVIVGYSLAFTEGSPFIGGLDRMFMGGMSVDELAGRTFPESVFAMFQLTFAVITPALITGAFADRMKFSAFMIFSAVWLMVVYVPIAHMVWGPKGFLLDAGVLDFAGGTVVHINAGVAGLVAALVIGKRRNIST
ncbi:MAG: ammonia channel protein, partial [Rhodospirillales bacterium]|nr:ammonia channel protein [Rhodospirillales bacterium]